MPTLLILSCLSHPGILSQIYPINFGTRGSGDVPRLLAHPTASSLIPLGFPVPYPSSGTLRFPWYIEGARLFSSYPFRLELFFVKLFQTPNDFSTARQSAPSVVNSRRTTVACLMIALSVQLCVQRDRRRLGVTQLVARVPHLWFVSCACLQGVGCDWQELFQLNSFSTRQDVMYYIKKIVFFGGLTNISGALATLVSTSANNYRVYTSSKSGTFHDANNLLAICRPSGCTVAPGFVVVVLVVVGVCSRSQKKTSKCTCLIFDVSIDLGPG